VTKNQLDKFDTEKKARVASYTDLNDFHNISTEWLKLAFLHKYMYNFTWLGRPIIQLPVDIIALQEIIWKVKPDLIIETGIAHGGSLVFNASMLALLDDADVADLRNKNLSKSKKEKPLRKVIGIDIDIREHNRLEIESHPLSHRIEMVEGIDISTFNDVLELSQGYENILVCLDSSHTHSHVARELELYSPLVSVDSYCIVFDTVVEDMPFATFKDRPWGPGNNPKTAVRDFLDTQNKNFLKSSVFELDTNINNKLLLTAAPTGWLRRIS
jgi:cephalosporin hydroxylase